MPINRIQKMLGTALTGDVREDLAAIDKVHMDLAAALEVDGRASVGGHLAELEQLFAGVRLVGEVSARVHARAMAMGELMSTALGAAYLRRRGLPATWLDAREILHSVDLPNTSERSRYVNASCDFEAEPAFAARCRDTAGLIVTQGFIASNARGETVILGRGGSDTSAAYFAAKLQAAGLEIWTDVPGMFSANPRIVDGARLLRSLSYAEAQEVASKGGLGLRPPRMVQD